MLFNLLSFHSFYIEKDREKSVRGGGRLKPIHNGLFISSLWLLSSESEFSSISSIKLFGSHVMQRTYTKAKGFVGLAWWSSSSSSLSLLPECCYMILSRFLSVSSGSLSWLDSDPRDDAPQICISISANRCSTSHCCWVNFALSVWFSDSTVWSRSRNRFTSPSKASWEPNKGVAPDSRWVSEPTKMKMVENERRKKFL